MPIDIDDAGNEFNVSQLSLDQSQLLVILDSFSVTTAKLNRDVLETQNLIVCHQVTASYLKASNLIED